MIPYDRDRDAGPGGPPRLLLVGQPGTGKSTLAATDFVAPTISSGAEPGWILVCSFTRAAAGVASSRAAAATGLDESGLVGTCSTIHAEAWRAVRMSRPGGHELRVLGGGLPDSRFGEEAVGGDDRSGVALAAWDLARHLRVPLEAVAARVAPQFSLPELRAVVNAYEVSKRAEKRVDFTDMLLLALEVEPLERELLIVDECQDLTPLMARLVANWATKARRVVEIGDADQAIHTWCGADPRRLGRLAEQGYAVRHLTRSHRVPRAAHALAVPLIHLVRGRVDAPYEPADHDGVVREATLEQALREIDSAELSGRPVLVLARSAARLSRWAAALAERATPFVHERAPCALGDPARVAAALAIVRMRAGAEIDAPLVAAVLTRLPMALFHRGRRLKTTDFIFTTKTVNAQWLRVRGVLLDDVLAATDLARALALAGLGNWARPVAMLVARHGERVLTETPRVSLTTMHGSKGREGALVVVDLGAPRLVRHGLADGPDALDLERRLVYVALTRTLDRLLLVRDGRHDLGEIVGLRPLSTSQPTNGVLA